MDIREMVGGDKKVSFLYYQEGQLWYVADNGFKFPVPTADTGNAKFMHQDKAILFMRYIKAHMKDCGF